MATQPKKFTLKRGDAVIETTVAREAVQLRAAGFRDVEAKKSSTDVAKTGDTKK
jgi:hypothetical protein